MTIDVKLVDVAEGPYQLAVEQREAGWAGTLNGDYVELEAEEMNKLLQGTPAAFRVITDDTVYLWEMEAIHARA